AELQSPAQPGAGAAGRAFLRGAGISGSGHGGGLYALYKGWADGPAVGRDGTIDHNGAFEFPCPGRICREPSSYYCVA
ncbi:hypothetical protein DKX15_21930, partial [Enterococcus faecium]